MKATCTVEQLKLSYMQGYHDAKETYMNNMRKGKWMRTGWARKSSKFICSNCCRSVYYIDGTARKSQAYSECKYDFCPWCLSDMRGE